MLEGFSGEDADEEDTAFHFPRGQTPVTFGHTMYKLSHNSHSDEVTFQFSGKQNVGLVDSATRHPHCTETLHEY